jgi:glyoxylase-like metal-dependent hydrolase (beta-lactamase superfamily II)
VRQAIFMIVVTLAMQGCASQEMSVIKGAADAVGDEAGIKAVNTLVIEGTGENFNLGQNMSPEAPLPKLTVTSSKRSIDYANGRWRLEQARTPTYITANTAPNQPQILGVDGNVAYNVPATGSPTRAAEQVAQDRHSELFHHPVGALRAALADGVQITNARKEGNDDIVDVANGSDKFTLYVDSTTKLPSKVVTMTYNANLGDVALTTEFSNYADSGGMNLPGKLVSKTDKYTVADISVSKTTVNGDTGNLDAPEDVKGLPVPPPTAAVTVEEAGKGLWYLTGGSHHSILIEFADHLAMIEAPLNEARTQAVIAKAKELKPDKPLRYLINTHHHFDHSGGVRAAIAEGMTIVTHESNKAFFEEIAGRKHSIVEDALAKSPKPLQVQTVTDRHVLKDDTRTVEIYHIAGNPHADTLLMVYFPAERILVQGDMFSPPAAGAPPPPGFPFVPNTMDNIAKANLRVDTLLPIHGRKVPFADMRTAAAGEAKRKAAGN